MLCFFNSHARCVTKAWHIQTHIEWREFCARWLNLHRLFCFPILPSIQGYAFLYSCRFDCICDIRAGPERQRKVLLQLEKEYQKMVLWEREYLNNQSIGDRVYRKKWRWENSWQLRMTIFPCSNFLRSNRYNISHVKLCFFFKYILNSD